VRIAGPCPAEPVLLVPAQLGLSPAGPYQLGRTSLRIATETRPARNKMHTHEVHACGVHAHEVHACEVHTHEMHAYEVRANEVHARVVHACEVHAREVHP
jgi:hypothetical protein